MLIDLIHKFLPKRNVRYDDSFFQEQWFSSWEELKYVLFQLIESEKAWKKILDFGCGPGIMIDFMNEKSYEYIGCDYSSDAYKLYQDRFGKFPEFYVNSLSSKLCQKPLDVFLSFDVFEHLTDQQIVEVLKNISHIPTLFLNISRTRGIPGHINLKSDRSWITFIQSQAYEFDKSQTERMRSFYSTIREGSPDQWNKNIFIFQKVNKN